MFFFLKYSNLCKWQTALYRGWTRERSSGCVMLVSFFLLLLFLWISGSCKHCLWLNTQHAEWLNEDRPSRRRWKEISSWRCVRNVNKTFSPFALYRHLRCILFSVLLYYQCKWVNHERKIRTIETCVISADFHLLLMDDGEQKKRLKKLWINWKLRFDASRWPSYSDCYLFYELEKWKSLFFWI